MKTVFVLLHLVPSQGDQSKLGGPKKSLSERSPGIGREEWPPITVVDQSLSRFCHLSISVFNICEWMNVVFILFDRRIN